jgi:hypothetical protein
MSLLVKIFPFGRSESGSDNEGWLGSSASSTNLLNYRVLEITSSDARLARQARGLPLLKLRTCTIALSWSVSVRAVETYCLYSLSINLTFQFAYN